MSELSEIIKKKKFKNFWYCFEYLLIAGYSQEDALKASVEEFGENGIFHGVAYVRRLTTKIVEMSTGSWVQHPSALKVGFITLDNIKLGGMFALYRKVLHMRLEEPSNDIEDMCEHIKIGDLSDKILVYFLEVSKKHFGYEAFEIKKGDNSFIMPDKKEILILHLEEIRQRMNEIVGIPPDKFRA